LPSSDATIKNPPKELSAAHAGITESRFLIQYNVLRDAVNNGVNQALRVVVNTPDQIIHLSYGAPFAASQLQSFPG
jgi:hypothetical protein